MVESLVDIVRVEYDYPPQFRFYIIPTTPLNPEEDYLEVTATSLLSFPKLVSYLIDNYDKKRFKVQSTGNLSDLEQKAISQLISILERAHTLKADPPSTGDDIPF